MTAPLFDSTRSALRFALNQTVGSPRSALNKMMSDVVLTVSDEDKQGDQKPRIKRADPLSGLDGAGQAALIARQLVHLTDVQRDITIVTYMDSGTPCSCRSLCCSGWRRSMQWAAVLDRVCGQFEVHVASLRTPGRRGIKPQVRLHRLLVERHFEGSRKHHTLDRIATAFDLSVPTVLIHKRLVESWLTENINTAVAQMDRILSESGIVGQTD